MHKAANATAANAMSHLRFIYLFELLPELQTLLTCVTAAAPQSLQAPRQSTGATRMAYGPQPQHPARKTHLSMRLPTSSLT